MSTADYRAVIDVAGSRLRLFNGEETQPDLHLIKQAEQVTVLGLEGLARRFARIRSMQTGDNNDPHISDLAIIGLADISLQKTARTARSG
jgi:hypothetical protein